MGIFEDLSEFSLRENITTESSASWGRDPDVVSGRISVREAYRLEEPAEHKPVYDRGKISQYKVVKGGTKALYLSYFLMQDGGMSMPGALPDEFASIKIGNRHFKNCRRLKHPSLPQTEGDHGQYHVEVFLFESD